MRCYSAGCGTLSQTQSATQSESGRAENNPYFMPLARTGNGFG
jgi:hypothetical protein